MFLLIIFIFGACVCEDSDLGYDLNIGYAIDVFANYGDLSQVAQVISADYDDDEEYSTEPFKEKNIRVFLNATSTESNGDITGDTIDLHFCDTYEDLLASYFQNFNIEGAGQPWKAYMGDWVADEIMRTFGLPYIREDNCCYVLVKVTKVHRSVKLNDVTDVEIKDYVRRAIHDLNPVDASELRRFMKNYGTHYIESFATGNSIYQVYQYKRSGYNLLKSHMRLSKKRSVRPDSLRYYFSSYFLKQIGDIRIASGNKTLEEWAHRNLRDSQYLYSRPNLLKIHNSPILMNKLNNLLDNGALLALNLKNLKPIFKNETIERHFKELVENDLLLWEVNS